jgi:hypothetical protein
MGVQKAELRVEGQKDVGAEGCEGRPMCLPFSREREGS